ncbi:MAG: TerC family protein [Gammaproteobacteria bacterium]|nr:TerC family protein [Gammaproteobacteria bacterium]
MLTTLLDAHTWLSLAILIGLEIILGIDNLVFLSLVSVTLPLHQQGRARRLGLTLAMIMRLLLLAGAFALISLQHPLLTPFGHPISIRDLFLLAGGIFLIWKSLDELRKAGPQEKTHKLAIGSGKFKTVVMKIVLLDMLFSIDSVMTAVGVTRDYWIMATAVIISILLMMIASGPISHFIQRHMRIRLLALAFLLLIGAILIIESSGIDIPRGYLFTALGFSLLVEWINWRHQRSLSNHTG